MGSSPSRLHTQNNNDVKVASLPATSVPLSPSCTVAELSGVLQQFMTRVDANFHTINENVSQLNARVSALESSLASSSLSPKKSSSTHSAAAVPIVRPIVPGSVRLLDLGFDPAATPPPVEIKYDVFLSHRRVDAEDIMRSFKSELSPSGYKVYLDRDALTSTDDLMSSVAASKTLLFFLSQHIFESDWCIKELAQAVRYQRQILLVSVAGCLWMDEKQHMCEFPIHLFPKYVVEHGGTKGIAVSFHRDFFDVVMNKIKQRLGAPMDPVERVQMMTAKSHDDREQLMLEAPPGDLVDREAEKEQRYEEYLKVVAAASRKNATELLQRISTLTKRFLNAKDAIEAINWLGASEAMKGTAVSSVRQQGLDAILTALNKFSTNEHIVQAAGGAYSELLNEANLNLLSYQPLFNPFLTSLSSPASSEQLLEAITQAFSILTGGGSNQRNEVSVQRPFNVFLISIGIEEPLNRVLQKYQDTSATVTQYCNQILTNLARPSEAN